MHSIGAITPLGRTWAKSRERLASGDTGIAPITHFDVANFPSRVAAAVFGFEDTEDRRLKLAEIALADAWHGIAVDPRRVGVFFGAESGRSTLGTILALSKVARVDGRFDHAAFGASAPAFAARFDAKVLSPAAVASAMAQKVGARGSVVTISLACASGNAAIAEGARAIRQGRCDVAICGGVGADVDPLMLVGFGRLRALSLRGRSCPFDVRRDGFVVGEGAAVVVLTAERQPIEIAGVGRTMDAHHLTAPDPSGAGAERAMRLAWTQAGCPKVDYVQAHGTSTPLNDKVEAQALCRVLGPEAGGAKVSSVKGAVGHWIAGAGAIGAVCAIDALLTGLLLPTAGLTKPDSQCPVPHVMDQAEARPIEVSMANAFAFGGANCSLIFRRTP